MEVLEKTQGWKEEEFDVVLQFMRSVLLKRKETEAFLGYTAKLTAMLSVDGASLIYTTPSMATQLQSLVHSSLGIHSLLKKHPLKQNVIDRDKIVVPPNWDSWGKIRVLREGFDVERVSNGWSLDLEQPFPPSSSNGTGNGAVANGSETEKDVSDVEGSAVLLYETAVQDSSLDALQLTRRDSPTKLEVETTDTQAFLAQQLKYLEMFKQKNEEANREGSRLNPSRRTDSDSGDLTGGAAGEGKVNEHIGPVQFNMGGIQVDADDMVQRLKVGRPVISEKTGRSLFCHILSC